MSEESKIVVVSDTFAENVFFLLKLKKKGGSAIQKTGLVVG